MSRNLVVFFRDLKQIHTPLAGVLAALKAMMAFPPTQKDKDACLDP